MESLGALGMQGGTWGSLQLLEMEGWEMGPCRCCQGCRAGEGVLGSAG